MSEAHGTLSGAYGLTSVQKDVGTYAVSTAATAAGLAASAAQGTVAGTAAVANLLAAAGASATVPYAGWIAAGALTTAAAIVNLVVLLRKRGVRKAQAVQMAQEIGFSDAAAIPSFTARALDWSSAKRARRAQRLQAKIDRKRGRGRGWRAWRAVLKLQLLGVIEAVVQAERRQVSTVARQDGPTAAARLQAQQKQQALASRATYDQASMVGLVAIIGGATLVAVLASRRRSG